MERNRPGHVQRMARSSGSQTRADTRFTGNRVTDPAPDDDKITAERADYAPAGAEGKANAGGTLKRTLKEFSEDNLTDWAAALTYYGVLALFPALIALVSIVGLVVKPQTLAKALNSTLTSVIPGAAQDAVKPIVSQLTTGHAAAGIALVIGLIGAVWSASGYVGAFTRAANVVYETP